MSVPITPEREHLRIRKAADEIERIRGVLEDIANADIPGDLTVDAIRKYARDALPD